MNYPILSEYVEAIKSAEDNFEQLKHLHPVLDEDGNPLMTSGNFAVVFKMKDEQTGKMYAVKCFLREQEGRAEAYHLIAEELENVSSTYLTPIRYLEKELFVDTNVSDETEFPVLLMDWVEGVTLDKYICQNINNKYKLALTAYQFSKLTKWLISQPFAHGDLKPDNIMVREDGSLVLVDYDGMYVPAMEGQRSRELGSPDYRLPSRTEEDFNEHIDDFPLVLIMMTIRAIQLKKKLFEELGNNDFAILHENDLRDLSNSTTNQKLLSLISDVEFARLYSLFLMTISEGKLPKLETSPLLDSVYSYIYKDYLFYRTQNICDSGKASKDELREAYNIFKQLSSENFVEAQVCLSCCLRNGYGCDKDINKGVEILQICAKRGIARAQFVLGVHYMKGREVVQNYEEAVKWYRKAADQGDADAQRNLGLCYDQGQGVVQSFEEAVEWYRKAAEQGNAGAQFNLGFCYYHGQGVIQNYEKAVEWYRKAAEQGNAGAQFCLGFCYKQGQGIIQSYEKAIEWYRKAADQGNARAQFNLGFCYDQGQGVIQSYETAVEWFKKAAEQGHAMAQCNLGICYYQGKGVIQSYEKAVEWYRKAAEQGYAKAQYRLGECYVKGLGVAANHSIAQSWLEQAAEQGNVEAKKMLEQLKSNVK